MRWLLLCSLNCMLSITLVQPLISHIYTIALSWGPFLYLLNSPFRYGCESTQRSSESLSVVIGWRVVCLTFFSVIIHVAQEFRSLHDVYKISFWRCNSIIHVAKPFVYEWSLSHLFIKQCHGTLVDLLNPLNSLGWYIKCGIKVKKHHSPFTVKQTRSFTTAAFKKSYAVRVWSFSSYFILSSWQIIVREAVGIW